MILTRKYWMPSIVTKENCLKINTQRFLNKTDMLILAEKKKAGQNETAEKLFKGLKDFRFFALKALYEKNQKEIDQRHNEILNALNGIQDYNIKDYTIKVTGRFPTDDWKDIENCLLKLANGIQIFEPLESNKISFNIKTFRENVKYIIAEQKIDSLFDSLKQYIVTRKCDLIKE